MEEKKNKRRQKAARIRTVWRHKLTRRIRLFFCTLLSVFSLTTSALLCAIFHHPSLFPHILSAQLGPQGLVEIFSNCETILWT